MTRIRPLYIAAFYVIALAGVCHAWGVATMIGGGTGAAAVTYDLQATFTQEAVGSNSYDFDDASSHYVSVADADGFTPTATGFSVAFWALDDDTGVDYYFSKTAGGDLEFQLEKGAVMRFLLWDDSAAGYIYNRSAVNATGKWTHVMVTWDGTTADQNGIIFYQNCVNTTTTGAKVGTFDGVENLGSDVYFGRSGTGDYFDGHMTKVLMTSDVITQNECKSIMRASNCAAYDALIDNEVACWDLDADTNSDIGSHNGTAQNGVAPAGTPDYPGLSTSSWALVTGQVLTTSFDGIDTGSATLTTNGNYITGNAITVIQNGVLISSDPTDGNMTYQVDVTIPANDAAADCIDIYIRYTDAANHDKVQICDETAGNDLEYISLPGPVTLASADIDWAQNTTYEVKITVSGDSIHQVDVDSVNKINDTTLEASNTAAVGVGVKVLNDPYVFDDFEVPQ